MPIFFVHGVNVRKDNPQYDYEGEETLRNSLFASHVLPRVVRDPTPVKVFSPYWGDLGGNPRWKHASIPRDGGEVFGGGDAELAIFLGETTSLLPAESDRAIVELAHFSYREAIDLLLVSALRNCSPEQLEELCQISARAQDLAPDDLHPPNWVADVDSDSEFLEQLHAKLSPPRDNQEVFGGTAGKVWHYFNAGLLAVKNVAIRMTNAIGLGSEAARDEVLRVGSRALLSGIRLPLQQQVSRFLGDVFVYLKQNDGHTPLDKDIIQRLLPTFDEAAKLANEDDPLLVVTHSMGGNIMYDILTKFRTNVRCRAFVTVGSQVSLFEELKLFRGSDANVPVNMLKDRVRKPDNVDHWLNIYDMADVLSFRCDRVFDGVTDYSFSTGKGMLSSHGTYFKRSSFHHRLGVRLHQAFEQEQKLA